MRVVEALYAQGHPLVKATHPTTLEVTKHAHLTPKGDCIIAVKATKAAVDLSDGFKKLAASPSSRITLTMQIEEFTQIIRGCGHPNLTFTHPTDLVARKSAYTCPRTMMIHADAAAADMPRKMVRLLQNPEASVKLTLLVDG
ncbi:MAG: DUF371 domain-containing protein [Candidatus Bathyarchaeia archaeon]